MVAAAPRPRPARLADATWPEVAAAGRDRHLVVPLGSCEQHGPHLPLATDSLIAEALSSALGRARPTAWVAPGFPFGASGEHAGFPGTLSLGTDALAAALVELVRSADDFGGVFFVCAHGGNTTALARAVARSRADGRTVGWWSPSAAVTAAALGEAGVTRPADAHAGLVETSVVLAVAPRLVTAGAAPGDTRPLPEIADSLRHHGVGAISANGVLGDPTGATAALGRAVLDAWSEDVTAGYDRWRAVVPAVASAPVVAPSPAPAPAPAPAGPLAGRPGAA